MYSIIRNNNNNNNKDTTNRAGRQGFVEDISSDSSSAADFLAHPFSAFRPSLFTTLQSPPSPSDALPESTKNADDTLPSLNDRSWIGARMSPIKRTGTNDMNNESNNDNNSNNNTDNRDAEDPWNMAPPSATFQQQPSFLLPYADPHFNAKSRIPSAGHQRTEYAPFALHPLQSSSTMSVHVPPPGLSSLFPFLNDNHQALQRQQQKYWSALVPLLSGLSLLGMGIWDFYYWYSREYKKHNNYEDDNSSGNNEDSSFSTNPAAWSLPWGQPSLQSSIGGGGLIPCWILLGMPTNSSSSSSHSIMASIYYYASSYGRLLSSAVQSNSVVEWILIGLAWWFMVHRYHQQQQQQRQLQRIPNHQIAMAAQQLISTSTLMSLYVVCVLTGQSWMLATWWLTTQPSQQRQQQGNDDDTINSSSSSNYSGVVAHCAAWGTCGVLCFVGMLRPTQRFGCFMICIGLVLLSLLQTMVTIHNSSMSSSSSHNPLPMVVGCIAGAFVGWALYGSHVLDGVIMLPPSQQQGLSLQALAELPTPILASMGFPVMGGKRSSTTTTTQQQQQSRQRQGHRGPGGSTMIQGACAFLVVMMWILPLLVLSYYDYYYYHYLEYQQHRQQQ